MNAVDFEILHIRPSMEEGQGAIVSHDSFVMGVHGLQVY